MRPAARGRLFALGLTTDETRWLLEVFEIEDRSLASIAARQRHAVWLARRGSSWRWWCCCGDRSEARDDLVAVLVAARMHFDSMASSSLAPVSIDHPIAAWRWVAGDPAEDDRAVAELAEQIGREVAEHTDMRSRTPR